jgi:hypothetical protein
MKLISKIAAGFLLGALSLSPVFGQEWFDATHLFDEEVRWLADNQTKETRSEFDLRTKGILQYADQKPAEIGDQVTFNTYNIAEKKSQPVVGVLKKIGKHCYVYVQKGKTVADSAINKLVTAFDQKIYPTTVDAFGEEWNPGIDGDPRITLFMLDIQDGFTPNGPNKAFTAGYFYAGDEYAKEKNPASNEREMLYLDIYPSDPTKDSYLSVVAHEFQHMIHWHQDAKEYTWVNEGMSQLASFINGYGHPNQVMAFLRTPDNSLTAWAPEQMIANYGQVYLYFYYLTQHLATNEKDRAKLIKAIVAEKSRGALGIEDALKKIRKNKSQADVFGDFCVTNFLNNPTFENGKFAYDKTLGKFRLEPMKKHTSLPFTGKGTVKSWSAQAVTFDIGKAQGEIRVSFVGQTQLAENKYKNKFDVAAVLLDKSNKVKPVVEWLSIRTNQGDTTLRVPAGGHSTLMLVVCNRGPEGLTEVAFARSVPPAEFSYSVNVAKNSGPERVASRSNRRVSRRTLRSMLEGLLGQTETTEDLVLGLALSSEGEQTAEQLYASSLEKQADDESLMVESIQASLLKNDPTMLQDFIELYQAATEDGKKNLAGMRRKVVDLVRFEIMQNNRTDLQSYLETL